MAFEISSIEPVAASDFGRFVERGLDVHPDYFGYFPNMIDTGVITLYAALQEERVLGQIAVQWEGIQNKSIRNAVDGLRTGQILPQTGFLGVAPAYRGQGIATALVRHSCEQVRAWGARQPYESTFLAGKYDLTSAPMQGLFTTLDYVFTDVVLPVKDHVRRADDTYGDPVQTDMRVVYKKLN